MASTKIRPAQAIPVVEPGRPRRRRRRLWILLGVMLALLILLVGGIVATSWYFSSQLLDVTHDKDSYSLRVLAVGNHTVRLTRDDKAIRPGTYALAWPGGRVALGKVISSSRTSVVRQISGDAAGLHAGTPVRIDIAMYASPSDLHLSYRTVRVPDPLGPMPAWYVPGRRHTWVIAVHGYKSNWAEALRPLPVLTRLGLPVLDMKYRNDAGAPQSSDHVYHLGATEWQDVQAGVRYAQAHSAQDVILYGYSMGGGVIEYFLHHSPYASRVRAVVLDSPALDWNAVLDLQATQRGLPGLLTTVAKRVIAYRLGLSNLDSLDAVRSEALLRAPTLLFQGTGDSTVPIGPSAAFARGRPDLVTYVVVPGAEHTQSWNVDPAGYDARLRAFLTRFVR